MTLTLNTFKNFLMLNFKDSADISLQDNLFKDTKIYEDKEFCQQFMGKFPVISFYLRDIFALRGHEALAYIAYRIADLAQDFYYLLDSPLFSKEELDQFRILLDPHKLRTEEHLSIFERSLFILCKMLYRYHGQKVIVFIDRFDETLDKASQQGYYDEMAKFMAAFLSDSFNDNPYLYKAVLTGCINVINDSFMPDFHNFKENSLINDTGVLAACMGFTQAEVHAMLDYYDLLDYEAEVSREVGGYCIGGQEIFCPLDFAYFCREVIEQRLRGYQGYRYGDYWTSTSTRNEILWLLERLDAHESERMQSLIDGKQINFVLNEELNYTDLMAFHRADDFWNLIYHRGYLTQVKTEAVAGVGLVCTAHIPNNQIRLAVRSCIREHYNYRSSLIKKSDKFIKALLNGHRTLAESILKDMLNQFVYLPNSKKHYTPKDFYTAFLELIYSNRPFDAKYHRVYTEDENSGTEVLFEAYKPYVGIIIDSSYTDDRNLLDKAAKDAIQQMDLTKYSYRFQWREQEKWYLCGIGFCHRDCSIQTEVIDVKQYTSEE